MSTITHNQAYDQYAAFCRKCHDRNAVHDLFNALAMRSIQETSDRYRRVYHLKASYAASLIIAGTY